MTHEQEIAKLNENEMLFNDQCANDPGRHNEPSMKIDNVVICWQCPYYKYKETSYCRGKVMGDYCTPNACLKATIDGNWKIWAMPAHDIVKYVKTEITKTVQ